MFDANGRRLGVLSTWPLKGKRSIECFYQNSHSGVDCVIYDIFLKLSSLLTNQLADPEASLGKVQAGNDVVRAILSSLEEEGAIPLKQHQIVDVGEGRVLNRESTVARYRHRLRGSRRCSFCSPELVSAIQSRNWSLCSGFTSPAKPRAGS